jgi:hypothetical protein
MLCYTILSLFSAYPSSTAFNFKFNPISSEKRRKKANGRGKEKLFRGFRFRREGKKGGETVSLGGKKTDEV